MNWTDALGLWSPKGHDFIFKFSFLGRLPEADIIRLQQASRQFDESTSLILYMHSLRKNESVDKAIELRNNFVRSTLNEARALAQSGNRNAALDKFAEAAHTISDSVCSLHVEPNGNPRRYFWWWPFRHSHFDYMGKETLMNLSPEILRHLEGELNNAYGEVFGP